MPIQQPVIVSCSVPLHRIHHILDVFFSVYRLFYRRRVIIVMWLLVATGVKVGQPGSSSLMDDGNRKREVRLMKNR